ncbi:SOS response-associated peptidase [Geobacter sp. FeAm09]|uniref:SOS response-associated peptidase n=1 Tax=Geobacter sp. FeAm09 TaxID=2597769 RepID=UPI0011ED81F8|nr:SOS response-associated peptidase [Geobacter sp. FeAm09]QEM67048.1 SOS response-associated peptidase [Geobacter sp. FeAm09]
MCGRFTSILSPETLAAIFHVTAPADLEPRYNIAPTQAVNVVRRTGDGRNRLDEMTWGLIPSWSRGRDLGRHMINARCETVHEKPAFRHAIRHQRCIVPASGFYEWQQAEGGKQPYYIHPVDDSPMGFAGIWEQWRTPEGDMLQSVCILTTSANTSMEAIHDRMPVILAPDGYSFWLDHNRQEPEEFRHLYHPYPPELLQAHKVPDLINNPRFDSPACIVQV